MNKEEKIIKTVEGIVKAFNDHGNAEDYVFEMHTLFDYEGRIAAGDPEVPWDDYDTYLENMYQKYVNGIEF